MTTLANAALALCVVVLFVFGLVGSPRRRARRSVIAPPLPVVYPPDAAFDASRRAGTGTTGPEPALPGTRCGSMCPDFGCGSCRLRAATGIRRQVRGELRCLACVEPVVVDSDGVWLTHAPQCPRAGLPLEVAIGQRPPDPRYPAHR